MSDPAALRSAIDQVIDGLRSAHDRAAPLRAQAVGTVLAVGSGVAQVSGLPGVRSEEILRFPGDRLGIAFDLGPDRIGTVLLSSGESIRAGDEVRSTGKIMETPVGEELLGRVVDPVGRPLDGGRPIRSGRRLPIERPAPGIMVRDPVTVPLQTGIQAVDALIPIGRGQRELIIGDRQTGKTAVALDTVINQKNTNVFCVYCSIGQESSSVARLIAELDRYGVREKTVVVAASGESSPGLKFAAPYAATSIAEYFMEQGDDALIVYDDLTRHARAYRELSLLLRRPPAREAYPGDIFYIHSRLLERSTHLNEENGGGSLTALPIIETQVQNISAYIPTNLVSITDGQIYLSPHLFQQGILPAIDVGKSVSRVGGKTQLPAYRAVAGDLRLSYSQFEELEAFSRFGTRLDEETRATLERGRRVREVLKQPRYSPIPVPEQIAVLLALTAGLLDPIALDRVKEAKTKIRQAAREQLIEAGERILAGEDLSGEDRERILKSSREALGELKTDSP